MKILVGDSYSRAFRDYGLRHAPFLFRNSMTDVACAVNEVVNVPMAGSAIDHIPTQQNWTGTVIMDNLGTLM